MPRGARLRIEGAFYHVYSRGNRRQIVFVDDQDCRQFLRRLRRVEVSTGAIRVAHCLMTNHFHLLIRPGAGGISSLMHRVLGQYALKFNRRHAAVGHVFQGRFGSRPLVSEDDLLVVLRYIHHNPLKAGMVTSLADWPWSSHHAYVERRPPPELACGVLFVRGVLARSPADVAAYQLLIDEPTPSEEQVFPTPSKASSRATQSEVAAPGLRPPAPALRELVARIAYLHGVPLEEMVGESRRKSREAVAARKSFIHEAVGRWGYPVRETAAAMGCSTQAVHRHLAELFRKRAPRRRPASGASTPALLKSPAAGS